MKTIKLIRTISNSKPAISFTIDHDFDYEILIRSFPGKMWSKSANKWFIQDDEAVLRKFIRHFKARYIIDTTDLHIDKESVKKKLTISDDPSFSKRITKKQSGSLGPVEIRTDNSTGKLIIKFLGRYDQEWIKELRQYGKPYYDKQKKEWTLPATRMTVDSLNDYFIGRRAELRIKKQKQPGKIRHERATTGEDIRSRQLGTEASEAINRLGIHLREKRYSRHTIGSYISQLTFFFKYFHSKAPSLINENDISEFMDKYVISLGYSASYQNQLITAIKTYYDLSGEGLFEIENLKRPKKGRPLPQVLSKDEVTRILNATRNLKHRLILWIIYSCGLRRGEVINIRLNDLSKDRGILHIRSGKGNFDRIVPVSRRVWEKMDEYIAAYQPKEYLFEGQKGGMYTASSVYNVFKQAIRRVGIKKDVGVHSLRHSYATHLHESGLDIRYIQELLGHKSSRTTEIYTHVSRRNLIDIRSPIDDLDLN
ncbi:MAG: site-specific integrase [Bacteroidales bacterium]|nr:site-specific integrase [Bacteroidales bacterium]